MNITKSKLLQDGVRQDDFLVNVNGENVPGVMWRSENPNPYIGIAFGHGGSQHKKTEDIRNQAVRYAAKYGWVCFAIDAPDHGDRVSREATLAMQAEVRKTIDEGGYTKPLSPEDKAILVDTLANNAVPEWMKTLDHLIETEILAVDARIGYWGVSQGSWIGIPLLAADPRYHCAVIGLSQLHPVHTKFAKAARSITIPLRYVMQWDDELREREYGLALFDTFSSEIKSMHINPGGHMGLPSAERESWEDFFKAHLKQ